MDGFYIFEVDDLDKIKDFTVGMKYEDFISNTSESEDSGGKIEISQEAAEKIDILRKAYLFDVYILQNKYGKYMNDVIRQYKLGDFSNDKTK